MFCVFSASPFLSPFHFRSIVFLAFSVCFTPFLSALLILSLSLYLSLHLHSFFCSMYSQPLFVSFSFLFILLFFSFSLSLSFPLSPNFHSYAFLLFSLSLFSPNFYGSCACLQIAHAQRVCIGCIRSSSLVRLIQHYCYR